MGSATEHFCKVEEENIGVPHTKQRWGVEWATGVKEVAQPTPNKTRANTKTMRSKAHQDEMITDDGKERRETKCCTIVADETRAFTDKERRKNGVTRTWHCVACCKERQMPLTPQSHTKTKRATHRQRQARAHTQESVFLLTSARKTPWWSWP